MKQLFMISNTNLLLESRWKKCETDHQSFCTSEYVPLGLRRIQNGCAVFWSSCTLTIACMCVWWKDRRIKACPRAPSPVYQPSSKQMWSPWARWLWSSCHTTACRGAMRMLQLHVAVMQAQGAHGLADRLWWSHSTYVCIAYVKANISAVACQPSELIWNCNYRKPSARHGQIKVTFCTLMWVCMLLLVLCKALIYIHDQASSCGTVTTKIGLQVCIT